MIFWTNHNPKNKAKIVNTISVTLNKYITVLITSKLGEKHGSRVSRGHIFRQAGYELAYN